MMRILVLINRFYPHLGGSENQVLYLLEELKKFEIRGTVLTTQEYSKKKYEEFNGIQIIRIGGLYGNKVTRGLFNFITYWYFGIRNIAKYDVVDIRSPDTIQAMLYILISKILKKKVVIRFATDGDLTRMSTGLFGGFKIFALKKADTCIAISSGIVKELKILGINHNIYFRTNCVSTTAFHPVNQKVKKEIRNNLALSQNITYVLYSGRLVRRKGINFLLEAWSKFSKLHPSYHLLILGSGSGAPDDIEDKLKSIVSNYQLSACVTFLGRKNEVGPYYQASDLFVLPSNNEGSPNVVLEAMACGIPVIATNIPGVMDIIEDYETGVLIATENPNEILKKLNEFHDQRDMYEEISLNGQTFIHQNNSFEMFSKEYMQLVNAN